MEALSTPAFTEMVVYVAMTFGSLAVGCLLGLLFAWRLAPSSVDFGFRVGKPKPFYGDQITTDPDAGTVTREGRR